MPEQYIVCYDAMKDINFFYIKKLVDRTKNEIALYRGTKLDCHKWKIKNDRPTISF